MGERLTRSDIEKIEKEIEERKLVKRPELIEAVKEARAQGDLSENFEYYAAKREKNLNESRIRYLERMLKFATIVEEKASADDEASIFRMMMRRKLSALSRRSGEIHLRVSSRSIRRWERLFFTAGWAIRSM